jgi:hypothetical protein
LYAPTDGLPNCPAQQQGFTYLHCYQHPLKGRGDGTNKSGNREFLWFQCNRCFKPVTVEVWRIVAESASTKGLALSLGYRDGNFSIRPERKKPDSASVHTPDNVASFYEQGCRAQAIGDADTAGMGFGKALDTATRQLIRTLKPPDLEIILRRTLKARIDWLHAQRKLTDDLKAWAHLMRDERNDASHEEVPYTDKEAEDLREFTYVYTLPGKIKERHPDLKAPAAPVEGANPPPGGAAASA